jgi:hypothetical protein
VGPLCVHSIRRPLLDLLPRLGPSQCRSPVPSVSQYAYSYAEQCRTCLSVALPCLGLLSGGHPKQPSSSVGSDRWAGPSQLSTVSLRKALIILTVFFWWSEKFIFFKGTKRSLPFCHHGPHIRQSSWKMMCASSQQQRKYQLSPPLRLNIFWITDRGRPVCNHSFTNWLTHSLTYSLTHWLTHSLTHWNT